MDSDQQHELRRVLAIIGVSGLAGLLVGAARGIVQERHGGWRGFARGAVASVVVAVLAALALDDSGLSAAKQGAIIGVLAYVADDMLAGLMLLSRLFAADPLGFVRQLWQSLRGGDRRP